MRLLVFLSSLSIALAASGQLSRSEMRAVDRTLAVAMKEWQIPGAAVAIVRNDRVVHLAGYGLTALEGGEAVTPDTLFQIASASKAFTATALAMLVDEGKLDWDDPVRKHLPYFRLDDLCADSQVTVRDIVSHRTGLGRHDELWDNSPWTREEVVRKIGALELQRPFRTTYQYHNILFIAAGEVVAHASGMSWDEFVRQRIFQPLTMNATVTSDADWETAEHALGYRWYPSTDTLALQKPIDTATLGPAGAIKSSARDMADWIRFQLGDGMFGSSKVLDPEILEETRTPQTVIRMGNATRDSNPESTLMSYAMGWVVQDYRGEQLVSHAGALNGFRTHVDLLPRRNTGFVVMINAGRGYAVTAIRNSLIDVLTGKAGRDWNAYYLLLERKVDDREELDRSDRDARRIAGTSPTLPLEAYAGRYDGAVHGTAEIALEDGRLVLRWSRLSVPLSHFHYDVFTARSEEDWLDERVTFELGPDQKVESLTIFGETLVKK